LSKEWQKIHIKYHKGLRSGKLEKLVYYEKSTEISQMNDKIRPINQLSDTLDNVSPIKGEHKQRLDEKYGFNSTITQITWKGTR
jgi:hypothetical protein